jgi:Protein of unknown function (DUF3892)
MKIVVNSACPDDTGRFMRMTRLQIDCVDKDDQLGPYERVRRVGGPNLPGVTPPDASRITSQLRSRGLAISDGPRWMLPLEDAIQGVLDGRWNFFIQLGVYDTVNVEVATSPSGRFYLRTEVDQDTPDELLFLPQCR